jgi:putative endonuclease
MAEVIAIGWLAVQFYRIQAWRWKCPSGEVDLIARRGQRLVFIEVKFRSRRGDAAAPGPETAGADHPRCRGLCQTAAYLTES